MRGAESGQAARTVTAVTYGCRRCERGHTFRLCACTSQDGLLLLAGTALAAPSATPTITEPATDGDLVHPEALNVKTARRHCRKKFRGKRRAKCLKRVKEKARRL